MQNFYLYFTASIFTGYVLSYKIYMGKLCRKEELEDKKKYCWNKKKIIKRQIFKVEMLKMLVFFLKKKKLVSL